MIVTPNWGELMTEYPGLEELEEEDIRQCLSWAAHNLDVLWSQHV
jgi:hypothetical protein